MTAIAITAVPANSNRAYTALRILGPIPLGAIMTMILLYAMYSLVRNDTLAPTVVNTVPIPSVIADFDKNIPVMQEQEPPVKPQLIERPPVVDLDPVIENPGPEATLAWEPPVVTSAAGNEFTINTGGQPMPIVRINPAYPANALSRGTEGYVDVMFDITPMGTTTNIRVIAFAPSSVFNSAVIKAVRGWKYKPASDGQNTYKTQDVTERINFQLEK